jgi:hypothetical protein
MGPTSNCNFEASKSLNAQQVILLEAMNQYIYSQEILAFESNKTYIAIDFQ